jgi:hypothetical protein
MKLLEAFRATAGDLARPFSIYASAGSASIATVLLAYAGLRSALNGHLDLLGAAAFIGAVWAGVGALYWGKAWETKERDKNNAQVEIARTATAGSPTPSVDLTTSSMTLTTTQPTAGDDPDVLPPDQRVKP